MNIKDSVYRRMNRHHKVDISAYLEQMLKNKHRATRDACLFLPSVVNMARQLGCSALDIQESMTELINKGYKFLAINHDTPVTVCITTS